MHFGENVVVNVRHNFDATDTLGICVGKNFSISNGTLFLVPEACGYSGRADGFGPELLVIGNKGRASFFSQNQYVRGTRPEDSFVYHWGDLLIKTNRYLSLGVDWQAFKTTNISAPVAIDIGPVAKVTIKRMYFRVWSCWAIDPNNPSRRGDPTLFLGIGYTW